MSTSFYVLPSKAYVPSYREILDLANANVSAYLLSIGIHNKINIKVNLQDIKTHALKNFDIGDKIIQNETDYAWFYFATISGGTDCYYYKNLQIDREIWEDELNTNPNAQKNKENILKNMDLGYRWLFRRSAGQPAIIALTYGMLAASLASLTDGIVFSDDGAWDYLKFPASADEFLSWYFQPEYATNKDDEIFTKQCIDQLKNEL